MTANYSPTPPAVLAPKPNKGRGRVLVPVMSGVACLFLGIGIGHTDEVSTTAAPSTPAKPKVAKASVPQPLASVAAPPAPPAPSGPATSFGDGTYAVGADIAPGTYHTAGGTFSCYWERMKDMSGNFDAILANDNVTGPVTVQILASDAGFKSEGCGTWSKIGH